MGKKAQPRRQAENEAKAYAKVLRTSARKLNVVAQSIRGKTASLFAAACPGISQDRTAAHSSGSTRWDSSMHTA